MWRFAEGTAAIGETFRIGRGGLLFGLGLLTVASAAQAAVLTAIHDYRYLVSGLPSPQREFPSLVHEFEGLAFTSDGSLWASIAPDPTDARRELWRLDLASNSVAEVIADNHVSVFGLPIANPVALGAAGAQLIVGENFRYARTHGIALNDVVWAFTPTLSTPQLADWSFSLPPALCDGVEGAASVNGQVYVSCGGSGRIVEFDPLRALLGRQFSLGAYALGLEALDDHRLLIGDYSTHQFHIFDLALERITESIDLADLFLGESSDYFGLTNEVYSVQVVPSESPRRMPDPDGLAYRDGSIYMSFDGDLRIFQIALDVPRGETPPVPPSALNVPEPGAMALVAIGLLGLAGACRRWRV